MYPWLPPEDPTPLQPIGLQLALADPHPYTLYLSRPCQLLSNNKEIECPQKYWTDARFNRAVIDITNIAIDRYLNSVKGKKIIIFGYSGGGAVATLVASLRKDVVGIVTVSGTLNHEAWTLHHNVSPLRDSLNPIDYATNLRKISQLHFIGEEDEIMPIKIANSYLNNLGLNNKTNLITIRDYDHTCCWVKNWPNLLKKINFIK